MEEDIKILENLLEEGFEAMCYLEAQAIEHLIKAYKELEEENKNLKTKYDKYGRVLFTPEAIAEKHIPKSKIKEIRDKAEVMDYYTLPDVIDDLNKLLEGK